MDTGATGADDEMRFEVLVVWAGILWVRVSDRSFSNMLLPTIRHDKTKVVFIHYRFSGYQRVNANEFIFILKCEYLNEPLQNKKSLCVDQRDLTRKTG